MLIARLTMIRELMIAVECYHSGYMSLLTNLGGKILELRSIFKIIRNRCAKVVFFNFVSKDYVREIVQ